MKRLRENPEFPNCILVQFHKGEVDSLAAETIALKYQHLGDFSLVRAGPHCVYMNFQYFTKEGKSIENLLKVLKSGSEVEKVWLHKDAPKFEAHTLADIV
jgi:hypothetical protein